MATHNIETEMSAPNGEPVHGVEAITTGMVWDDWFWSRIQSRTVPAQNFRHGPFKSEAEAIRDACRQLGGSWVQQ